MNKEKKEKAIFTEGEYVVANYNCNGAKRGMIGMVDEIISAENNDQFMKVIFPYGKRGTVYRKTVMTWGKFLEHMADEAADNIDIQLLNNAVMNKEDIEEPEFLKAQRWLHRASEEVLIGELQRRGMKELEAEKIIFNDPATIVFWTDGTKTVVKCAEGQEYSEYFGYLAALGRKMYGTNSAINRMIREKGVYGKQRREKEKEKEEAEIDASDSDTYTSTWEEEKLAFCAVFSKRKKARAYLEKVRKVIETYGSYSLLNLKEHNGEPIIFHMDDDFGWRSADEIRIRKISPTEWKVVFPPAEMLR